MKPSASQLPITAYKALLKSRKQKRLMVEGSKDRVLFKKLIHELKDTKEKTFLELVVDSSDLIRPESLIDGIPKFGAREIVEMVCRHIRDEPFSCQFIGFVDREYREFDYFSHISDNLSRHYIDTKERVIWSRGHSIENYLFDKNIIRDTAKSQLSGDWFEACVDLFEEQFTSALRIACAVGMSALETQKISIVEKSIHWTMLFIVDGILSLNTTLWEENLITRNKMLSEDSNLLASRFQAWIERLKKIDDITVRWLCHGHIGLNCIQSSFLFCVSHTCPKDKKARAYIRNFETDKFRSVCEYVWMKNTFRDFCEHPLHALKELGFDMVDNPVES